MHHLAAIALATLIAAATASDSRASPECGQIEDSLKRLTCYDALYRNDTDQGQTAASNGVTWEDFDRLTKSNRPDLITHAGLDGCRLYFRQFELEYERFAGSSAVIRQILIPLSSVDLGKSGYDVRAGGVNVTMVRDASFTESTYIATAGFKGRFRWAVPLIPPPPTAWETEVSSELHLRQLYRTDAYGNVVFRADNKRSGTWNFASAYPEDAQEIADAFLGIVRSCQGS